MVPDQQFSLRWGEYRSTLVAVLEKLLENGVMVDCTLSAEGQSLETHRAVVSACSPYLELLLSQHNEMNPVVILKDIKFEQLKAMVEYMYRGEVIVSKDQIESLLVAAESLQIKGLAATHDTSSSHSIRDEIAEGPSSPRIPFRPTVSSNAVEAPPMVSSLNPSALHVQEHMAALNVLPSTCERKVSCKTESEEESLLHWRDHRSTLVTVFERLLGSGVLVDCTLAAEGQYIKAHKAVLCACSPYFELILNQRSEKYPIIILKDVKFEQLKAIIEYMYSGEVIVSKEQIEGLCKVAESLQIKGLVECGENNSSYSDAKHPKALPIPNSDCTIKDVEKSEQVNSVLRMSNKSLTHEECSEENTIAVESKVPIKSESDQQFSLRWSDHGKTIVTVFQRFFKNSALVDCTLSAEGQHLKVHKTVLSACSLYFEMLLNQISEKHPIVILKDVKFEQLKTMIDYMYHGEVVISKDQIQSLRMTAEYLQVKGLTSESQKQSEELHVIDEEGRNSSSAKSPPSHYVRPKKYRNNECSRSSLIPSEVVTTDIKSSPSSTEAMVSDLEKTQKMELMSAILLQRKSEDVEKIEQDDSDDNFDPLPDIEPEDDLKPATLPEDKPIFPSRKKLSSTMVSVRRGKVLSGHRPFKCLECGKTYRQQSSLSTHKRSHRGDVYRCDACNKPFNHRSHLIRHLRVHTTRVEKLYPCAVCGKVYKQPGSLATHSRQHDEIYKCDMCNKVFSKRMALIRHMSVHSSEKLYKCQVCGKAYRQRSSLSTHHRVHRGEGVMCDVCGKVFNDSSHLKRHSRAHTGEKPYKCATCGKAFAQHFILTNHVRIHTGEKPFVCELCGKAFRQPGSLHNHRRDMHQTRPRPRPRPRPHQRLRPGPSAAPSVVPSVVLSAGTTAMPSTGPNVASNVGPNLGPGVGVRPGLGVGPDIGQSLGLGVCPGVGCGDGNPGDVQGVSLSAGPLMSLHCPSVGPARAHAAGTTRPP